MEIKDWKYLGDGVYAMCTGYHVVLHIGSHDNPTDKVYLEQDVFNALLDFVKPNVDGDEDN